MNDAVFCMLPRGCFEKRLRRHFDKSLTPCSPEDPAWYALRNTVYAYGARHLLAKQNKPHAFADAIEQANRYFQNALSVHSDLLFVNVSRLAVQALAVMVSSVTHLPRVGSF
jgi:hypothetical protein